jgi:PBP1b-binding outer membrane lipoprotein LpoB
MKKAQVILVILTIIVALGSCRKSDYVPTIKPNKIDLGVKSTSTAIKAITQTDNTVVAQFETTAGSKYAVQIVPFGSEEPVKNYSFTATDDVTTKTYDLSGLSRSDYDLIFIDVDGKEVKYPLVIK